MISLELLIFDIEGKMAHFRKVYSNSSSLSYIVPPRTTIIGIIAAVLGKERDTYYKEFNKNNCDIALRINKKNEKIIQSVNYLRITSSNHFRRYEEHTQVPFEILVSEDKVSFRIYFHHKNPDIMKELLRRIKERRYVYPPYMGSAAFNCTLELVDYVDKDKVKERREKDIEINSIIPFHAIGKVFLDEAKDKIRLCKENMVSDFNENREGTEIYSYIIEENGYPIKIKSEKTVYKIEYKNIEENIVFM